MTEHPHGDVARGLAEEGYKILNGTNWPEARKAAKEREDLEKMWKLSEVKKG